MSADSATGAAPTAMAAAPGPDSARGVDDLANLPPTTKVTIKLEKLNPSLKLVSQEEVELTKTGDEKTAFRFTVDKDGAVTATNKLFKDICHGQGGGYNGDGEENYDTEETGDTGNSGGTLR